MEAIKELLPRDRRREIMNRIKYRLIEIDRNIDEEKEAKKNDSIFDSSADGLDYFTHKVSLGDEKLTEFDPEPAAIGALHEVISNRS